MPAGRTRPLSPAERERERERETDGEQTNKNNVMNEMSLPSSTDMEPHVMIRHDAEKKLDQARSHSCCSCNSIC